MGEKKLFFVQFFGHRDHHGGDPEVRSELLRASVEELGSFAETFFRWRGLHPEQTGLNDPPESRPRLSVRKVGGVLESGWSMQYSAPGFQVSYEDDFLLFTEVFVAEEV
jgi:hypothetical protein